MALPQTHIHTYTKQAVAQHTGRVLRTYSNPLHLDAFLLFFVTRNRWTHDENSRTGRAHLQRRGRGEWRLEGIRTNKDNFSRAFERVPACVCWNGSVSDYWVRLSASEQMGSCHKFQMWTRDVIQVKQTESEKCPRKQETTEVIRDSPKGIWLLHARNKPQKEMSRADFINSAALLTPEIHITWGQT